MLLGDGRVLRRFEAGGNPARELPEVGRLRTADPNVTDEERESVRLLIPVCSEGFSESSPRNGIAARDRADPAGQVRPVHPRPVHQLGSGDFRFRSRQAARDHGRAPLWNAGARLLRLGAPPAGHRGVRGRDRRRAWSRPSCRAQPFRAALGRRAPPPAAARARARPGSDPQPVRVGVPRAPRAPRNPTLQTALTALVRKELVGRDAEGQYAMIEPFFGEWLQREQRDYAIADLSRRGSPRP
jgi:hypothetical protein